MPLNSFDRNYGASKNSREFWGGNNSFVTVALHVDIASDDQKLYFPGMSDYDTAKAALVAGTGTDADQTLVSNAERNFFKMTELLAQRGVIVVSSIPSEIAATDDVDALIPVGSNILASVTSGTTDSVATATAPIFHITFMVERADVFTADTAAYGRVGSSNPSLFAVDPAQTILDALVATNGAGDRSALFEAESSSANPDGSGVTYAADITGGAIFVHDALPALRA